MAIVPCIPLWGPYPHYMPLLPTSWWWGVYHIVVVLLLGFGWVPLFFLRLVLFIIIIVSIVCCMLGSFGGLLICIGSLAFAWVGTGVDCTWLGIGFGLFGLGTHLVQGSWGVVGGDMWWDEGDVAKSNVYKHVCLSARHARTAQIH